MRVPILRGASRKNFTAVFFLVILSAAFSGTKNLFAQTPNYLWAKSFGGPNGDVGQSVATDSGGNIYVTGYFHSPSITIGSYILTNQGSGRDVFLAKYDSNGNVLWATSAGGTNSDYCNSITTDDNGNIIVTGSSASSSITFGAFTLTNAGIFIVKYDGNGNVLWATGTYSISGQAYGSSSIAVDNINDILVTGAFSGQITFGTTTLTSYGGYDVFIAKYDSGGNVLWAIRWGGNSDDYGKSVAIDGANNILVSCSSIGNSTYLLKYDSNANLYLNINTSGYYYFNNSVSSDINDNIIVAGSFISGSIGGTDIFMKKYDTNGNFLWGINVGESNSEYLNSIVTDGSGNIIITGSFLSDSITFGSYTLVNANAGVEDIFLVKYDSSGNVLWAISAGKINSDYGYNVATDSVSTPFFLRS